MVVKEGDRIMPGTIIAEVPETRAITHKVMVPPDAEGYVLTVVSGRPGTPLRSRF